jgi:hypothetical protein
MAKSVKGEGWLTNVLKKIPAELHIPGYNFCGPNTKLEERLARGDKGINPLDEACLEHDKIYASTSNKEVISEADKVLSEKAWERFKNKNTPVKEKLAAMLVTGAMKAKRKVGGNISSRGKSSLATSIREAKKAVKSSKSKDLKQASKIALKVAKRVASKSKSIVKVARILPIPKRGGVLPFLVPLFAVLSAAGALAGGAAAITKAVNDAASARKSLEEDKRHNRKMEAIAIKPRGSGFFLKPYKNGYGLMTKSKN